MVARQSTSSFRAETGGPNGWTPLPRLRFFWLGPFRRLNLVGSCGALGPSPPMCRELKDADPDPKTEPHEKSSEGWKGFGIRIWLARLGDLQLLGLLVSSESLASSASRERWLEDPSLGSQGRTVFFSVLEQPLPPLLPPGRRGLVVLKCGRLVKSEFS